MHFAVFGFNLLRQTIILCCYEQLILLWEQRGIRLILTWGIRSVFTFLFYYVLVTVMANIRLPNFPKIYVKVLPWKSGKKCIRLPNTTKLKGKLCFSGHGDIRSAPKCRQNKRLSQEQAFLVSFLS